MVGLPWLNNEAEGAFRRRWRDSHPIQRREIICAHLQFLVDAVGVVDGFEIGLGRDRLPEKSDLFCEEGVERRLELQRFLRPVDVLQLVLDGDERSLAVLELTRVLAENLKACEFLEWAGN